MEPKLVYRTLRQLSDWSLKFYSERLLLGQDNVPKDGPLIVVSTHHNEILDIATLSTSIPHGRPVCFWAKSSLFKNPIVRNILLSSGSIPVHRNPNNVPTTTEEEHPASENPTYKLFQATFHALGGGKVVGIFPEGTSSTEPQIAQVKDGAAWVALEYFRWLQDHQTDTSGLIQKPLKIIPVSIVYTDKSQYQSRMVVRWGSPIEIEALVRRYALSTRADSHSTMKELTEQIHTRLVALSINAPDWETIYSAQIIRDIVWSDPDLIPLVDFVSVTQSFINTLKENAEDPSYIRAKASLLEYFSLLHYSGISHASLASIYPSPQKPSSIRTLGIWIQQVLVTVLHPRLLFFLLPLIIHLPGYLTGYAAYRLLSNRKLEETRAQFKSVFGGFGFGISSAIASVPVANYLLPLASRLLDYIARWHGYIGKQLARSVPAIHFGLHGGFWRILGRLVFFYGFTWLISSWHDLLVKGNFKQAKKLTTSWKVFAGSVFPPRTPSPSELAWYRQLPHVPQNSFIKRRVPPETNSTPKPAEPPRKLSRRSLIAPLLEARVHASLAVRTLGIHTNGGLDFSSSQPSQ